MDRRSVHRSQENVGGGQRMPMMSRGAQRRPLPARRQPAPIDDQGSDHDSAEVGGGNDNESRRRSQTRPDSNYQSFAQAAQTFQTAVGSAWNRFEHYCIRRDGTSPIPLVERGSTAIYHTPSILQFYFTDPPPRIRSESYTDHSSNNPAPSVSNNQPSSGWDTHNPRKRKRSEEDDEDEDSERLGPVDTVIALLEGRRLSRADRDALIAALDSAETPSDEGVEGNGEGESNDDDIGEEREVLGGGESVSDDVEMQGNEGVSGYGQRPQKDAGIQSDEGGPGNVEGEVHTQEFPDGDTIVVRLPRNHQSRNQDGTEDVTRGRGLSRTGSHRQRRAGSSSSEEDLYGSSVSPRARDRPDSHEDRNDQSVADDDADQSEGKGEDELSANNIHETPPRPRGRPNGGTAGRSSRSYRSSEEMTTVSATVEASNILGAVDGRRTSRQSRQNSVAASGPAEGAGHAVSAQRHVEERRILISRAPKQTPELLRERTAGCKIARKSRESTAALPSIPEEGPRPRSRTATHDNPKTSSKRKRQDQLDSRSTGPSSLSPASAEEDLAAMGLRPRPTQFDSAEDQDTTQRHHRQIDPHPRQPESKNKSVDERRKPFKLTARTGNVPQGSTPRNHEEATEEAEGPSAGSEGDTSPLTSLATESEEEEEPPLRRPHKRQKTRHPGRD
ncbi:hypothetical protein NU219Hw_g1947t1 [Hortaea werneckii]